MTEGTWEFANIGQEIRDWAEARGCSYVMHHAVADRCQAIVSVPDRIDGFLVVGKVLFAEGSTRTELLAALAERLAEHRKTKIAGGLRLIRGGAS